MKKLLISAGIMALLASSAALAQAPSPPPAGMPMDRPAPPPPPPMPRSITVSGDSHAEFTPDQAVLSMSLVSKDKNLAVAKKTNDAMTEQLVEIAHKLSIPTEKIATSNVSISPEYTYNNSTGKQQFIGYNVNRSIRITTDAANTPEKLLSAVVEAKIDQVEGVEYMLADPDAQEIPLRVKAFENAKAKAEALAAAAGSKLGPALDISTVNEGMPMMPPRRSMPMMAKAMAASSEAPSLPGMIDLRESVTVTFGLE